MQAQTDPASFAPSGGSGTLQVTANRECTWSVQSEAGWITVQAQTTGQGDGSVRFTVSANEDPASRSGGLMVNDRRLQITQEGRPCEFRLSSTRELVEASGARRTIRVDATSSQCTWSVAAEVSWITIVGASTRSGSGEVSFDVGTVTGPSRTGAVTIAGQRVEIVQGAGCSYATGASTVIVAAEGGFVEVAALAPSGCAWTAQTQAPWITVAIGGSGSGNGVVRFSVAPNDGPPRSGSVSIAGLAVSVTQSSGCRISIEPASHLASIAGGAGSVAVRAAHACAWTAASTLSWISITSGASGAGDGEVRFVVASNSGPARSGALTIGDKSVSVSQPSGCSFTVTPTALDLSPSAQSSSVSVSTGTACPWTASSGAAWITVPQSSGGGPTQVTAAVAANNGPRRSGTFTVAGHVVQVSQASPCTWVLAPPAHEFDANGGGGNVLVVVAGACIWTAESTVNWITIGTGASGTGNGLVQFSVAPNPGAARSSTLRIAGIDYQVRQAGR